MIIETITVSEAAKLRGVHRDTIYQAILRDEIREVVCGKIKRVLKEDVMNWAAPAGPGRPKKQKEGEEGEG